ncbi:schwannomin-interacting protein 1 [Gadus morhua]|uniref:schwannomin-interacting protein 1 n=1 Tax=Gadus morhua TaxID=8049 RepID=UPI0011B36964|nr:schwannomin-interacting protein 1-like [Gadus morhua]
MEGEKEREHGEEEKESDEAEDEDPEGAALAWQEGSGEHLGWQEGSGEHLGWQEGSGEQEDHLGWQEGSGEQEDHLGWQEGSGEQEDHLGLPIMHWEALSLRIAELEKQDLAKPKKTKDGVCPLERRGLPRCWTDEGRSLRSAEVWEDREEEGHLTELTSRLQTRVNLQLCFINDSESDEEAEREEKSKKRALVQVPRQTPAASTAQEKSRPLSGLRRALRALRARLRTDLTRQAVAPRSPLVRTTLDQRALQGSDPKQLGVLRASLSQAIQDLNSELVGLLQTRDQLRTEQDAMLVEVQDLTSL